MSKIGIFGGAFNPIHNGHLFIAKESLEIFGLDKVIFVPTGNPVFKKEDLLDKYVRANLVEIAIKDEPGFEISYFEINRDEPSYYIETLLFFRESFDDIYSIIGEDAFVFFHKWKNPQEILNNSKMIIAERFEDNFAGTKSYISEYFKQYEKNISFLTHPFYRVSSTVVRERIKQGKHIDYLVPDALKRIILSKGYYKV
ncbi:MAG: nicotinate-nucleotide adenylyltransferase [Caldisericaceae bacterium]